MNEDRLKEIIADTFDIDEDEVNEETSNETVEQWDSLNHLRLVTAIEGEFGVSLTMDEINGMTDYPKIIELVTRHAG